MAMLAPELRFDGYGDAWEQRKLGELASIVTGSTPPTVDESNYGGGYPFVSPGDIAGNRFIDSTLTTLSERGFSLGRFIPARSSLFVCIGSTVGKVAQANRGVTTNQQINSLIPSHDIDPDFLYSLLEHAAPMVRAQAATQAVPIVNKSTFESMEVSLPRFEEQQYISAFLLDLDNLITLHRREHDKLVTTKQAMLQKMLPKPGEDAPEVRFEGFTDAWEQRKLGELGFAQSGIGFPDAEQGGSEGTPFFKVSDMNTPGNERELIRSNNYVTNDQIVRMGWHPISQLPAIFFAKVGAAVMLNRKRLVNEPFLLDNNTMAFSMDTEVIDSEFGQSLFETLDLTSLVQVGALPSYNASDVEAMEVSLPPSMSEQHQLGELFQQLDNLITLHQRELKILKQLKSALLQKMFV